MSGEIKNAEDEIDTVGDAAPINESLSMSDDDFDKQVAPPVVEAPANPEKPEQQVEQEEEEQEQPETEEKPEKVEKPVKAEEPEKPVKPGEEEKPNPEKENGAEPPATEAKAEEPKELTPEEFTQKILTPFKANGKDVQVRNADEAIKLMQMGANYTKKMQALQPHLKLVKMLEEQGIADENQLSFLIDVHKKNPAAINKLIKDSGIDPLDIDSEENKNYKATNYSVSDQKIAFDETARDISLEVEGKELLTTVKDWDKDSKEMIWQQPVILKHMTAQKQTGIYQTITAEIDRLRMLGELDNIPFVQAYFEVGQVLQAQGKLGGKPETKVVETRLKEPKPVVDADGKVRSAAPVRQNPTKVPKQDFNPLAMSDDEFLKSDLAQKL